MGRLVRYLARNHVALLALFAALGGTAYAVGTPSHEIHACAARSNGAARIAGRCHRDERVVTWAKTGPPGIPGPRGVAGPRGAAGLTGPSDGYYASGRPGSDGGSASLDLPPGDYMATGGCITSLKQTADESTTVPVFGQAVSGITTNPLVFDPALYPGAQGTTYETTSSVPNMGQGPIPPTTFQTGYASLTESGPFTLPHGGTIYEVCQSNSNNHDGFGNRALLSGWG